MIIWIGSLTNDPHVHLIALFHYLYLVNQITDSLVEANLGPNQCESMQSIQMTNNICVLFGVFLSSFSIQVLSSSTIFFLTYYSTTQRYPHKESFCNYTPIIRFLHFIIINAKIYAKGKVIKCLIAITLSIVITKYKHKLICQYVAVYHVNRPISWLQIYWCYLLQQSMYVSITSLGIFCLTLNSSLIWTKCHVFVVVVVQSWKQFRLFCPFDNK